MSPARPCCRSAASKPRNPTPIPVPPEFATQNAWLSHGRDPQLKSVRLANYVKTLRRDLVKVAEACGVEHPGLIDADSVEVVDGRAASTSLRDVYHYQASWGSPLRQIGPRSSS
jgi:hypothetical protein